MSWLSTLFTGNSSGLSNAASSLSSTGSTATQSGLADTKQAGDFYSTLLSGNTSAIGKLLAPQINNLQKSGQQQVQSLAQFGNRSGGTNAAAANIGNSTRAGVNDMISSLTGSAASGLGSLGSNLLGQGIGATNSSASIYDQILKNQQNSILGKGIGAGVGAAEAFGLGAAGGALAGTGAAAGGQQALLSAFGG
jgi:hypothetical protein